MLVAKATKASECGNDNHSGIVLKVVFAKGTYLRKESVRQFLRRFAAVQLCIRRHAIYTKFLCICTFCFRYAVGEQQEAVLWF